ncbi:50S ribosomal L3, chloroplastic [Olea europaea subsp. europaea]|uniref:50S ribosomal L3, chloroplastic n=1 Tax=Olea europaea subsp. europaea TaxID=158383 RepID=A0A8S0PF14_OLEEU|nr:50S ribosomal L3, chloroplastic [Olea europaea subsp. europaea]
MKLTTYKAFGVGGGEIAELEVAKENLGGIKWVEGDAIVAAKHLRLPIKRLSKLSLSATTPKKTPLISVSMEAGIGVMGMTLGMMSFFDDSEAVIPVIVVGFREGNIVTQVKTELADGYNAVHVEYRRVRDRKLTKPEMGIWGSPKLSHCATCRNLGSRTSMGLSPTRDFQL